MTEAKSNPRDIAVWALCDRAGNVSARLARLLTETTGLVPADRALAGELALGACRHKNTLRAVLKAFLAQPDRKLPAPLEQVLDVGAYQLVFASRVPDFAAVNEAVQQTVRLNHRRKSGFINGVLRTVARNLSPVAEGTPPIAANIIPVSTDSYRMALSNIFSDPQAKPAEYLSDAYSLPIWLAARWLERFGSLEEAAKIAMQANTRAPIILRANSLRSDVQSVLDRLRNGGVGAQPHENRLSIVLTERRHVPDLPGFDEGLFQVQDPTATSVAVATGCAANMNVLDFCAAPGTKTTHMAELMGNRGSITAVDVSPARLDLIRRNCRRMGVDIVQTILAEQAGSLESGSFGLVLADVPCSNSGVLSRRAEARWRLGPDAIVKLVHDQKMLASAAASFVRKGGRFVYSTCSIEPEENSQVAHWLGRKLPQLKLIDEKLTLPGGAGEPTRWHDGGYYAIFEA